MTLQPISKNRITDSKVHLSFRDILLVPHDEDFCSVLSRKDPDISTEVCVNKKINIPFISAPMDSVTTVEMCIALDNLGCLGIYTRHINDDNERTKQAKAVKQIKQAVKNHVACAVGVRNHIHEHVKYLCDVGMDIVCLDIANGNHAYMQNALKEIRKFKDSYNLSIIAGNVASGPSAIRLANEGADCIKIGIGPGAACSTRRVTGFGVPQFTAILDCAHAIHNENLTHVRLIADGGIRHAGDITKAIWAGANSVMMGWVFAGHDECGQHSGKRQYRGMSSRTVSKRDDIAAEGVVVNVANKGPVKDTVTEYAAALRASCSMANAMNLDQLRSNAKAIRVSTITHEESDPVRSTPC